MARALIFFYCIFLSACAIDEIPRQPLLTAPLGLTAKFAPAIGKPPGTKGIVLYFTCMNPEIYFSGYAIFVSTNKKDFSHFPSDNIFFPICPTDVPGNTSQLLKNVDRQDDDKISIYIGVPMSFATIQIYPPTAIVDGNSQNIQAPSFSTTSFVDLPNGSPFVVGTKYFFAAYAYSTVDNVYSLPSNIAEITYS